MALSPGTRLGPYEIVRAIGAGGMGEVYRARDTRLDRDVAIKVLPTAAALDPDRLARFDREARLLASLNHPHIATLHGIEHTDGIRALVLELVEGDTLAEIVARGPLPVREALRLAGQIADALDAAHAKGVIHRDLKPANIKVTPGRQVKVLDFGLAKAFAPSEVDADDPQLPTVTYDLTREGLVIGTAAYMSPEQARGQAIDKRTDIWAFGCVLYEMLTGRRAFAGETKSDTIAAILHRDPDWSALPASLPSDTARLLHRCLEKDLSRRLRDIGNTRADIDESVAAGARPAASSSGPAPTRAAIWTLWLPTAAAVILAALLIAQRFGAADRASPPAPPAAMARFVETVTAGLQLAPAPSLALTQDGRRLAYVAVQDGVGSLYVRDLGDATARPLAGTEDADQPFFSPDGRWIGFFADSKLKRVAVAGGAPITIASVANPRGGTWLLDNTIIFSPSAASVLMRVSAEGGKAEPASTLDRRLNEASHRWPHALPGGNAIVYGAGPTVSTREWMEAHVVAQSLVSSSPAGTPPGNRRRVVAAHGTFPHFVLSGHLLYSQSGLVYAHAFDPDTFQTTGDAFPILERITMGASINGGSLILAISPAGNIAYAPGFDRQADVVLLDRGGKERVVVPAGSYFMPRLSPDGRQIVLTVATGTDSDVWIHDIQRGATTKLTSGGRNLWPLWSPDGTRVAYASSREGSTNVYWRRADGSGAEEQVTSSAYTVIPQSWTRDGRYLVVTNVQPDRPNYVALMPTEGPHTIQRFETGDAPSTMGSLSADGRWMAYVSAESGRLEVYVRPYPGPGPALQISTAGGDEPSWAGRGLELVFRRGETLFSVSLTSSGGRLTAGAATPVFTGRIAAGGVRTGYDVSADGRTLVFAKLRHPRENLSQFTVLLNTLDTIRPTPSPAR
jgi:Tol biopolymer transport system component